MKEESNIFKLIICFLKETINSILPLDFSRIRKMDIFYLFFLASFIAFILDDFYPRYYQEFTLLTPNERAELIIYLTPSKQTPPPSSLVDMYINPSHSEFYKYYLRYKRVTTEKNTNVILTEKDILYFNLYGEYFDFLKSSSVKPTYFTFSIRKSLESRNEKLRPLLYKSLLPENISKKLEKLYEDRAIYLWNKVMMPFGSNLVFLVIIILLIKILNYIFKLKISDYKLFFVYSKIYFFLFIIFLPIRYIGVYYNEINSLNILGISSFIFVFTSFIVFSIVLIVRLKLDKTKSIFFSLLLIILITLLFPKIMYFIGVSVFAPLSNYL
jgi:hypothetical protein